MSQLVAKIVESVASAVKEVVTEGLRGANLPKGERAPSQNIKNYTSLNFGQPEHIQFAKVQLPFINTNKKRDEEEERKEELETERGDLLKLELKQHLAQLKTPGLELKPKRKEYGKRVEDKKQTQNQSALIYDLVRNLLHIFPWFFNFIKGFLVIRSTKQN